MLLLTCADNVLSAAHFLFVLQRPKLTLVLQTTINNHEFLPLLEDDDSDAHAAAEFVCTACTQATWSVLKRYQATRVPASDVGAASLAPEAAGDCRRPTGVDVAPKLVPILRRVSVLTGYLHVPGVDCLLSWL